MRSSSPKLHPQPQNFEQFAVYWTDEPGWHTELQLRNNLVGQDLTVTPALRTADGSEVPLAPVTIRASDVISVDVHEALMSAGPQYAGLYGSIALRYTATVFHALYAAVMVHDAGHPIAFHLDAFPQPKKFVAGSREGIWWLPQSTATDYLILTNTGDQSLESFLTLYDSAGKPSRQKITIAARQTQRLSVRTLLRQAGLAGSYGGIEIAAAKDAGYLDTAHVVFDEAAGFSAIMKMFQHHPGAKFEERAWGGVKQWTTRAPMLALTNPDSVLAFPAGTQLEPKVFVRNASSKSYMADMRFNWHSETGWGTTAAIPIALGSQETKAIDVAALQAQKLLPAEATWAAVVISAPIKPDELMAVAASYDQSLRHGVQTPFTDQLAAHWEGGKWEVDATHDSIVTAGNGGSKPVRAQVTLFFNGGLGKYQIEQTLSPNEQLWLDLGKLIRNQVPDKDGRKLPSDLTSGTYQFRDLTDRAVGNIFEGKVILDKTFGHAAYGCMICCGYPYGGSMWTDPLPVGVNDFAPQDVGAVNACSGSTDPIGGWYSSWWTGNTSIATAGPPERINGIAGGTTGDFVSGQINGGDGMTYVPQCPMQPDSPAGGVNVRIPYQEDRVPPDPINLPNSCASGFAGRKRSITGIVADQWNTSFTTDGVTIGETLSVGQNNLELPSPMTGSAVSSNGGKFGDTFFFCSRDCPGSGETDAVQTLQYGGIPLSLTNGLRYQCTQILWNNQ